MERAMERAMRFVRNTSLNRSPEQWAATGNGCGLMLLDSQSPSILTDRAVDLGGEGTPGHRTDC